MPPIVPQFWQFALLVQQKDHSYHFMVVSSDGVQPVKVELWTKHATSYEMSCPEDPWIPTCRISMILTIKGVEILFDAILIRSEIVALDFPEDDFLEELQGVDLAHEFDKIQTFASMSRGRLSA